MRYEPPVSMSREKFWLHVALFLSGIALLIALIYVKAFDMTRLTNTANSIMVTLLVIAMIELVPEAVRLVGDQFRRGQFRRLFGDSVAKQSVKLVHANRMLKEDLSDTPFKHSVKLPAIDGRVPTPEGALSWIAHSDSRAAVYIANQIYRMTGQPIEQILDSEISSDNFDGCVISLGLGFNSFTHRNARICNGELFDIKWGESPKKVETGFCYDTDNFTIGGKEANPEKGKDYCIIARIVSRAPQANSERVTFTCAGRTAAGTVVAGYFLAFRWQELLRLYKRNNKDLRKDSLVVVIQHPSGDKIGQTYDSAGVFAKVKKEGTGEETVFAEWGLASGMS